MNEQLIKEIEALEEEAATYRRQGNYTKYNEIMTEANQKRQQLTQIQVEAQVEEKVAEAQAMVSSSFDSMNISGQVVTLGELAVGETERQLLQIYILQLAATITEQSERKSALLAAQLNESEEKREKIHAEHDLLVENVNEIRKQHAIELSTVKLELDDMTTRRDAAANELTEAKAEIERLNSRVEDLQIENAIGAKAAVNIVTNMDNDKAKELLKKLNDSKPAIYDIQPLDNKRSQFSAKLANDDAPITFGYLEKGKYREVTPEEAAEIAGRFRAEQAAAEAEQIAAAEAISVPTVPVGGDLTPPQVPPIQTEVPIGLELAEGNANGESAVKTFEERLKALEAAVFGTAEVAA